MLFCHGDRDSVTTLSTCLTLFSNLSGLSPNVTKSRCFLANVNSVDVTAIMDILRFERGFTPTKFLGVPLISTKLSATDCKPLLDRITARVSSWTNKLLSFSGRLQLIRVHWLSFLSEEICTAALGILHDNSEVPAIPWTFWEFRINSLQHGKALLCKSMVSRSLGIKLLCLFPKADLILSSLMIGTMLVFYYTCGMLLTPRIWRKVLNLRSSAVNFIRRVIGHGSIIDFSRTYDTTNHEQLLWGSSTTVSTAIIWDSIRRRGPKVEWWNTVWNQIRVPRFSFYLWLAFHRGFRTKDVLLRYGVDITPDCPPCASHNESFHHLFFTCRFSFQVLFYVMRFCGWRGFLRGWPSITNYVINLMNCSRIKHSVMSLGLAAVVYYIWRERNARMHGDHAKPAACLGREIVHLVKCRLHSSNKFRKNALSARYSHLLINNLV